MQNFACAAGESGGGLSGQIDGLNRRTDSWMCEKAYGSKAKKHRPSLPYRFEDPPDTSLSIIFGSLSKFKRPLILN